MGIIEDGRWTLKGRGKKKREYGFPENQRFQRFFFERGRKMF